MFHNKGHSTDQAGARTTGDSAFDTYEFTGTGLGQFPISKDAPIGHAEILHKLGSVFSRLPLSDLDVVQGAVQVGKLHDQTSHTKGLMITHQEELDWRCYGFYGLTELDLAAGSSDPPRIELGQRALEIVLARKIADGEVSTNWF